jgi:type I restriction enzyme S subunit
MGQAPNGEAYNLEGKGWPLIAGAGDFGEVYPKPKKYTTEASKLSQDGDIILGIRASIGDKVLSNGQYCLGRGVACLRPRSQVNSRYLWHWLDSVREKLSSKSKGATFKQVTRNDISELELSLPPLEEQKRIAEILDRSQFLISKRQEAIALLDTLTQAIFIEMFGDPVTNPRGWERKPIKEIGQVITGNTPSRANPDYYGTAIEWIKSDNINTPHYYLTQAEEGLSEVGKEVARRVSAGAILVTCIAGSPACIGNAAIVNREVAFNQQINALVPQQGNVHFLFVQILTAKRLIQDASTASMKGMVSKSRFEEIRLIFPPLPLQKEFAQRVEAVEKLKATHRASLTELQALFASLQHRAFRGEL